MPDLEANDEIDKLSQEFWFELNKFYSKNKDSSVQFATPDRIIKKHREAIQRLMVGAEQRGVAWSVMAIDDLHINHGDTYSLTTDIDRTYKGIKNTIRDRFKLETGIDPAPDYPIHAELQASLNTKQGKVV